MNPSPLLLPSLAPPAATRRRAKPATPGPETEEEISLLRQVAAGDQGSFGQLYERFSGVLFSTAFRVLNDPEAAEDVRQDVFLQIWEKAPLYDAERGKPLTWAVTLTRNKAIDRLRSTQRRQRLGDELEREADAGEKFDDRDSFGAVDRLEQRQLVRAALTRLSADQRAALELAFFRGLTQSEIAAHLGEPLGTIKARIRRGLKRLREMLEPQL